MKKSRFTEHQIVGILHEAEPVVAVKDLGCKHDISSAAYDQWKSKYGGIAASDLKRLKELEGELAQYERNYGELAHEDYSLKDVIAREL